MNLSKAFEMTVAYTGIESVIKVDSKGYICLNDFIKYFPNKRLDVWRKLKSTKEYISIVNKDLKTTNRCELNSVIARRGKYNGGTFAHEYVAMEFAMWLSPEFKLSVIKSYQNGSQKKENWNIKRILSAFNYKLMSTAIEHDHKDPKFYHYTNEAIMINKIVFGKHEKCIREIATENQLDLIASMEGHNATLIRIGLDFQERKKSLKILFNEEKENESM